MLLYKHALESIFAHLGLSDLENVLATCRDWSTAVNSMRPIGARIDIKSHVAHNARLVMYHVAEIRSIGGPLYPPSAAKLATICDIIKQNKSLTKVGFELQ